MCGAVPARTRCSRGLRYLSDIRKLRANSLISRVALFRAPLGRPPPGFPQHGDHAPAQPLKTLKIGSAETPRWVLVVVRIDQRRSRVSIEMESTV